MGVLVGDHAAMVPPENTRFGLPEGFEFLPYTVSSVFFVRSGKGSAGWGMAAALASQVGQETAPQKAANFVEVFGV